MPSAPASPARRSDFGPSTPAEIDLYRRLRRVERPRRGLCDPRTWLNSHRGNARRFLERRRAAGRVVAATGAKPLGEAAKTLRRRISLRVFQCPRSRLEGCISRATLGRRVRSLLRAAGPAPRWQFSPPRQPPEGPRVPQAGETSPSGARRPDRDLADHALQSVLGGRQRSAAHAAAGRGHGLLPGRRGGRARAQAGPRPDQLVRRDLPGAWRERGPEGRGREASRRGHRVGGRRSTRTSRSASCSTCSDQVPTLSAVRPRHRSRDRPLADRLVLGRDDRQGLELRASSATTPSSTATASSGRVTDTTAGTAKVELITDHEQRRLGAGAAGRADRDRRARGGQPQRPAARLHRLEPDDSDRTCSSPPPAGRTRPPASPPRTRRGSRSGGSARPSRRSRASCSGSTSSRSRICATSTTSRSSPAGPSARGCPDDRHRRIALRIALIVIAAVILQTSFFSLPLDLRRDAVPAPGRDRRLGLLGGAVVGAVSGFAAGFLLDSILLQTLGVSSLVLLSVGYLAGRYREGFEFKGLGVPALLSGRLHAARERRRLPRSSSSSASTPRSACSSSARSSSSRCWRSRSASSVYPLCHRDPARRADRLSARAAASSAGCDLRLRRRRKRAPWAATAVARRARAPREREPEHGGSPGAGAARARRVPVHGGAR